MTTDLKTSTEEETSEAPPRKPRSTKWTPYLLILPTVIFLALFFAYPMARGLSLAIWDDEAFLSLHEEASAEGDSTGKLRQNSPLDVLDRQANVVDPADLAEQPNLVTEIWFNVSGVDPNGQPVSGWTAESRIRVRAEDDAGNPTGGTVRSRIGAGADPLTSVFAEASGTSQVVGQLEERAEVQIADQTVLEIWYQVRGETDDGDTIEGWAQSRFVQVFDDEVSGRVDRGDSGELTTRFIQGMANHRFFGPALRTTLLLMVIIIPIQFVLAMIMSLVIQARLKGHTSWLYIFAIPLGVSDLAVGIVFFAIFTQNGFLNSILEGVGLIDSPATFLSADTKSWIIVAIVVAEVWRATSIVMIILVSGLQAISSEVLEAAELFGANLWRRVRYVILPLLRPSIQVALILRTILALQVFAVVIVLSGGDVVTVLTNETYRQYDEIRNSNVAAAYAVFILLLSMVSAVMYLYTLRTQKEKAA